MLKILQILVIFIVSQQKTIINYEKSQPSSIDNPVVDPNFNTMRAEDAASSTATYIVVGLLVVATIALLPHGGISQNNNYLWKSMTIIF